MNTIEDNRLLAEAAEWRLLGMLFECPKPGWREQVAGLGAEVPDPDLQAAAERAQAEAGEGAYHSIFGPGGPAAAREVSYIESVQLGYLLSELGDYYAAFAYPASEPRDHVSVEANFLGYLRLKEAFAAANSSPHQAVTREAAEHFLADHLSMIAEPLAKALECCGQQYLTLAGRALLRRTGPRRKAGSNLLPVLGSSPEDCGFACGES